MGNAQLRQALDTRNYRIDCSFYIREDRFQPVRLEWDRKEGDDHRTHRYKWKYGKERGELVYPFMTPKTNVFVDILRALGFQDAQQSDLWRGKIQTNRRDDRSILAFAPRKRTLRVDADTPEFYIDDGMLEPVELSQIRSLFPDPSNSDNVTFHGSAVYYRGQNKGTIVYRPHTHPRDLFRLALKKLGYYNMSAGHFRTGSIEIDGQRIPILTFRVAQK